MPCEEHKEISYGEKIYEIENFFKILKLSILMARYFWYLQIAMWRTQRNLLRWKIYEIEIFFKILTKSTLMARLIFKDNHEINYGWTISET